MRYVVAVYNVELAYGGSEEGGWWYEAGTLHRILGVFRNEAKASAYRRRASKLVDQLVNKHRRPISSVLSDGRYSVLMHEHTAPENFPSERPHYE